MTLLHFREATPTDAAALVRLHEAIAASHAPVRWRVPSRKKLTSQMKTPEMVVGEAEHELAATFRLELGRTFHGVATFTPVASSVYLLDFGIHPAHRKQGMGRATLAEVERRARAHGAQAVRLDTNHDATGACNLYVACGYRVVMRYAETFYLERLLA